ncbi:MAG: PspC domain-containing protein [Deltaproteobacteria bacterium]|nr:PspC domain-containing protein [Deltaproteobacteria bacterium]
MSEEDRKLYRSRSDRILFGVCGGLGARFSIEPALVRLVFILLSLANGLGLILYGVFSLLFREEPGEPVEIDREEAIRKFFDDVKLKTKAVYEEIKTDQHWFREPKNLIGTAIILIGVILLAKQILPFIFTLADWGLVLAVVVFIAGLLVILKK